jgi:hypothetical protein
MITRHQLAKAVGGSVVIASGLYGSIAVADSNTNASSLLGADQRWHLEQAGLKPRYRVLPRGHRRIVRNGLVYYRIRGHYYRRRGDHWELFRPPEGGLRSVENLTAYPDMPRLSLAPRADLSSAEVINDKAQCHYTSLDQSGFDPTLPGAGVEKSQYQSLKSAYRSAMLQCLAARGYQSN